MTSKFPALEEIDQDLGGSNEQEEFQGDDDFLARERAVLGDDADEFGGQESNVTEEDKFESQFPALDSNDILTKLMQKISETNKASMGPSGIIADSNEPYLPGTAAQENGLENGTQKLSLEDSPAIKEWRQKQRLEIERRDEVSEAKKSETREKAKRAIDDFYEDYNTKKDDIIAKTQEEEKSFIAERDENVGVGSVWDQAAKLVDTNDMGGSGRDKSRFKELLLSLRGDANAPGAAGYQE